jgi:hypothetical protein
MARSKADPFSQVCDQGKKGALPERKGGRHRVKKHECYEGLMSNERDGNFIFLGNDPCMLRNALYGAGREKQAIDDY